jgi:drug/metabolite transporter (DMT)-like permease
MPPSRAKVIGAYLIVYVIWGSTYLALRYMVASLPPFAGAAMRYLVAGGSLYAFARFRGHAAPTRRQWRNAAIIGGLLLLGGNGAVTWAETRVASGVAALLVASEPLWVVILDWLRRGGQRPTGRMAVGLVIGFVGVAVLVGLPGQDGDVDMLGAALVVMGAMSWAAGSLYAGILSAEELPKSPLIGSAAQMLVGCALLGVTSVVAGEPWRFELAHVNAASVIALAYLIVFGSLVAFNAYVWLTRNQPPQRVATYAFVNPIVAVFLGWIIAGEPLGVKTLVATAIISGAVALIVTGSKKPDAVAAVVDSEQASRRDSA